MDRNFLKDLKLDSDTVDKIMTQYGKDVQQYKDNASQLEEFKSANQGLKDQLSQRDNQLKDLKKNAGDNEELKSQLEKALADNKEQAKNFNAQLAGVKKNNAISNALRDSGAKNAKAVAALMDLDKVSLDDNGNLIGLSDQLKSIKKSDGYLFQQEEPKPKPAPHIVPSGNPSGGNSANGSLVEKIAQRMKGK